MNGDCVLGTAFEQNENAVANCKPVSPKGLRKRPTPTEQFTVGHAIVPVDQRRFRGKSLRSLLKSLVQQHQLVYRALGQNMQDEVIHALALRTLTPEQHAAEGGR